MADLIDRAFDTLERGAAVVGTILGVDMSDVAPRSSGASIAGPAFRIEEVISADTGKLVFVVTDGAGTSCDAPTRALAEATLDELERKGAQVVRELKSGTGSGSGTESGKK